MNQVHIRDLTQDQARQWLLDNDPEGRDLWLAAQGDLPAAVWDNLRDFGVEHQSGEIDVMVDKVEFFIVGARWEND